MTERVRWDDPDWEYFEPVQFEESKFQYGSALTVILLAGVIIGLLAAFAHLAG